LISVLLSLFGPRPYSRVSIVDADEIQTKTTKNEPVGFVEGPETII